MNYESFGTLLRKKSKEKLAQTFRVDWFDVRANGTRIYISTRVRVRVYLDARARVSRGRVRIHTGPRLRVIPVEAY